MTIKTLLTEAVQALTSAGIEEASNDARLLFEEAFGMDRASYFLHVNDEADKDKEKIFLDYIQRRAARQPLQYITGKAYFMGLEFSVDENVLIPRFDTEILVENALKNTDKAMHVLDMCTGSGCIAISMALLKGAKCTAVDYSSGALAVARKNAVSLNADVEFIQSDMFDGVYGLYDVILSNPPYIRTDVIDGLEPEVKVCEPMMALDGGADGLYFYRILAKKSPSYLKANGLLMMEIGFDQAEDVSGLLEENQFTDIRVIRDLAGLERVVCGRRK